MNNNTKKMVTAALMASFTCIATMIIKIPTPTLGYIHMGDGLVLLCGMILGPFTGGLAAGIGSMFSDIFSGYVVWAPATLCIKALSAGICGMIFHNLMPKIKWHRASSVCVIIGGIGGEAVMVLGYFVYEAGLAAFAAGSLDTAAIAAGLTSSAAGIVFNIAQGIMGIVISLLLLPGLKKIPDIFDDHDTKNHPHV